MENLTPVINLVTLGAVLVTIVISIRKPNEDQNSRIISLENNLTNYTKHLIEIRDDFKFLKENDLKHIELELRDMSIEMAEIKTILKERLPNKGNGFK